MTEAAIIKTDSPPMEARDVMAMPVRGQALPSGAVMVSQSTAFLQMIERASRDPAVDIEKFRQLMLMKREVEAQAAEREFDNCMADAQAEIDRKSVV